MSDLMQSDNMQLDGLHLGQELTYKDLLGTHQGTVVAIAGMGDTMQVSTNESDEPITILSSWIISTKE